MRKIRSGQTFLFRSHGYNSTVIEIQMKDMVSGSDLQEALRQTGIRFPYMMDKLVEKDGYFYLCRDTNSLVAVPTDKFRRLGSMTTGYHLLDVTYHKNLIRVAFHHGLCDGRGVTPFVESLIYYYVTFHMHKTYQSDGIRLVGDVINEKEYEEPFGKEYFEIQEHKNLNMPNGCKLPESCTADHPCYKTDIILDESIFVRKAKENGATPAIFLSILMSNGINKELKKETVVCNLAMDLRGVLGKEMTHCNCVGTAKLPYFNDDSDKPLTELAEKYRKLITLQREENAVKSSLNRQIGMFNRLDEMNTLEEKKQMLSFFEQMTNDTYVISYLGRLRLNDYADQIEKVSFYNDSIGGMTINMIAAAGKITVTVLQSFADEKYVNQLTSNLQKYGLLEISKTQEIVTGQDKAHITASKQLERFFIK